MFDQELNFDRHLRGVVSGISRRIRNFRMLLDVNIGASVLLRCFQCFLRINHDYFLSSFVSCHLQHLKCQALSVARFCLDQSFLQLFHRRCFSGMCIFYKQFIATWLSVWLVGCLPACRRIWILRVTVTAHPYEIYEVNWYTNILKVSQHKIFSTCSRPYVECFLLSYIWF